MGNPASGLDLAVILVVGILVLSGCRLPATGAGPTVAERTVTPAPVETESPTGVGASPSPSSTTPWDVPGIEGSSADVDALLTAHERHLAGRSYTLVWSRRVSGTGPGIPDTIDEEVAIENESRFRIRITESPAERTSRHYVTYVDRSGVYRLTDEPNASRVDRSLTADVNVTRLFARRPFPVVRSLLGTDAVTLSYVAHDGTRYARLVTRRTPPYLQRNYEYDVREFSATVWVHPDGYLRSVYYQFALVRDGERATVSVRYSYTDVGTTAVTEPRWVERLKSDERLASDGQSTASPGTNPTAAPVSNQTLTASDP